MKTRIPFPFRRSLILGLVSFATVVTTFRAANAAPALEIFSVVRDGDARKLRELLRDRSLIQARDKTGATPLISAALYANAECVRLLLEAGADVDATNHAGATALLFAAGDYSKVRLLLARGANPNARSALGNTALILAANQPDSRTVKALLQKGADARTTNIFGVNAAVTAAAAGNVQSLRLVIAHGADVNASPSADPAGFVWSGGRTALMWAALLGHEDCVKLLLEKGADPNAQSFLGTPLIQAAWRDNTGVARQLLQRGAQVDLRGGAGGFTPLLWAASTESENPEFVKLLLAHGANVNIEAGEDWDAFNAIPQTPLMQAWKRGRTPIVETLLAAGAKPGAPTEKKKIASPTRPGERIDAAAIRAAVERAMPPLQETAITSASVFLKKQSCLSCHQQYVPLIAVGLAQKYGLRRNEAAERAQVATMLENHDLEHSNLGGVLRKESSGNEPLLEATFHPAPTHTSGYWLLALAGEKVPADARTDAFTHFVAAQQGRDGRWYNLLPRPPIQGNDVSATALGLRSLQLYPLPGRKEEFDERIARAGKWLAQVKPASNDERVFQLLGLRWAGESPRTLASKARALISEQRADGGWSQLARIPSDAYATGMTLYALHEAGIPASHPARERGVRYLLQTQLADGTWFVPRRAFPFQPTMASGFAYGKDAWISATGTSWAAIGLTLSLESARTFPTALSAQTR